LEPQGDDPGDLVADARLPATEKQQFSINFKPA
jgi:hypothetical protein